MKYIQRFHISALLMTVLCSASCSPSPNEATKKKIIAILAPTDNEAPTAPAIGYTSIGGFEFISADEFLALAATAGAKPSLSPGSVYFKCREPKGMLIGSYRRSLYTIEIPEVAREGSIDAPLGESLTDSGFKVSMDKNCRIVLKEGFATIDYFRKAAADAAIHGNTMSIDADPSIPFEQLCDIAARGLDCGFKVIYVNNALVIWHSNVKLEYPDAESGCAYLDTAQEYAKLTREERLSGQFIGRITTRGREYPITNAVDAISALLRSQPGTTLIVRPGGEPLKWGIELVRGRYALDKSATVIHEYDTMAMKPLIPH